MKGLMLSAVLGLTLLVNPAVKAQTAVPTTSSDLQALEQWLASQQAHVGSGFGINGVTYADTWWDAVSAGQTGINVGKAGALDYVDLGPAMSVANAQSPRYGIALPVHVGNIWSNLHLPGSVASHVVLASLPNIVLAPATFYPRTTSFSKWTWKNDFQLVLAYTFGGS